MTDLFDTDLFLELKCRSHFLFAELKIFLACGSCRFRSCLHGLFPLFEPGGWASSWREGLTNRLIYKGECQGKYFSLDRKGEPFLDFQPLSAM